MKTRMQPVVVDDQQEQVAALQRASEAGDFDQSTAEMVDHLIGLLPDGYALDEESRVVRLDPGLPDHLYVSALINGTSADPVRIPVHR